MYKSIRSERLILIKSSSSSSQLTSLWSSILCSDLSFKFYHSNRLQIEKNLIYNKKHRILFSNNWCYLFSSSSPFHTSNALNQRDYYEILNIEKNSTKQKIKHAYYKLSKKLHPDVNKEPDAENKFKEIQEAYHILGDEKRKQIYDESLREGITNPNNQESSSSSSYGTEDELRFRSAHGNFKTRTSGPIYTGKTNYYDFDDYYKSHYGNKNKSRQSSSSASSSSSSSSWSTSSSPSFSSGSLRSFGSTGGNSHLATDSEELKNYWNRKDFGSHNELRQNSLKYLFNLTILIGLSSFFLIATLLFKRREEQMELKARNSNQQRVK